MRDATVTWRFVRKCTLNAELGALPIWMRVRVLGGTRSGRGYQSTGTKHVLRLIQASTRCESPSTQPEISPTKKQKYEII